MLKKNKIIISAIFISLCFLLLVLNVVWKEDKKIEKQLGVNNTIVNDYSSEQWLKDNCVIADDNTNEQFIIKSNKTNYQGLNNIDVYFSVKNLGYVDNAIISFPFSSGSGHINYIKEFGFNTTTEYRPIMENTGETKECSDGISTSTCDIETQTGTTTVQTTKDILTAVPNNAIRLTKNQTKYYLANIVLDSEDGNFSIKVTGTNGEGILSKD